MNDNTIDGLIRETLDRRALLDELNSMIIQDVRQRSRRTMVRRWARVAVFCVVLPLMALLFSAGTYLYLNSQGFSVFSLAVMLPAVLVFILTAGRGIANFSPDTV